MKFLMIVISLISTNSWAGLEVQHCSNGNLIAPIHLCMTSPNHKGKLILYGEKISLDFTSGTEDQPVAEFILASTGQTGTVQQLGLEALIQIGDETPTQLKCSDFRPGSCRN